MDRLLALRVFVRIAEVGAFSKAADSLNIPRPTVTKLVQDLERRLGTKLLHRTTRRVSVTPEGAAYYERASHLVGELDDMDEALGSGVQPKGSLRVDIGSSLASMILIPALGGLRARYPELRVDIGVSDRPADLIGETVDCVIRGGAPSENSLLARRIANLEWVTCASPVYLEARGVPKHPSDLEKGHTLAGYVSSLTGKAFPLLFERGDERIEIHGHAGVAVNESTAHLTALLNGLGISQTFGVVAARHLASGALKAVLTGWKRPRQPLYVVYPSNRHLSAKLRVFVEWVTEVFAPFSDRQH